MNRSQIAIEYVIVMGFATVILLGYLIASSVAASRAVDGAESSQADLLAAQLQAEIVLAAQVRDGYTRTFEVPTSIGNSPVTITGNGRLVRVQIDDSVAVRTTPLYEGTPVTGENTITRQSGVISFV